MNESEARDSIRKMISYVEEEAKEKAREIEAKTEHEYNLAKAKYLHEAKEKLQAEYDKKWKQLEVQRRINKSTSINSSRMNIMKARNECMISLTEETRLAVADRVKNDPDEYKEILKNLLIQGFIKLLDSEVTIMCREEDQELVQEVLEEAQNSFAEIMQNEAGKTYSVTAVLDEKNFLPPAPEKGSNNPSCSGGIILLSHRGKIRCQNTLDDRLELTFNSTLPLIRSMIFS